MGAATMTVLRQVFMTVLRQVLAGAGPSTPPA
jgi:hypothetical protein